MYSRICLTVLIFIVSQALSFTGLAGNVTRNGRPSSSETTIESANSQKDSGEGFSEIDINAVPPILDPEYRHKKSHQFEFEPYGGLFLGSTLGQTWNAGGKIYYHLNNTFAVGANYAYSWLLTDRTSSFGQILENTDLHIVDAELSVSNDAALRVGKKLIEMDFYLTLGVGAMDINNNWEPAGLIGGGVKVYTGLPWLAFKVDVNNFLHKTQRPGKNVFDVDVAFVGGVALLFPARPSAYEKTGEKHSNP